ncbi:MAG: flagellar hook-associated protein FlgL [Clostridiales bacterium]|jgi:flagellar hook-associated protein 3 FlgL|nr:flagellar hook-associated protein FlgL [Clostridiales bacterium]
MRITNNMLVNNMIGYMSMNLATMSKYQTQASTGRLIQKASDDPVVAARSLKLNTDMSVLSQYQKNASSALAWMTTTETAVQSISTQIMEVRKLVVQASNSPLAEEDRQAIASQIKQMRDEIISLANSTYSGRYIFSGYKSDTPLLDENGFFNTVVSQLEKINYEVGVTNKLQVNVTGDSMFNLGTAVGYLPARSALVQDIDDVLAMLDAKATVTSSAPLNLTGPGVFDMTNIGVDVTLSSGTKTINFNDANVPYVNRMTSDQIIDFINKKLGLDGTASLDKNGDLIIRSLVGGGVSVADAAGAAAGSVAALLGGAPVAGAVSLTGSKSLTQPVVDVSAFNAFSIVVDRSSDPISIDLSAAPASTIADRTNARLDEIAAEINRQIAVEMANTATDTKWAKCTVEDGRLCLTSESFGTQSFIELSGGQEVFDLFGVTPSVKQGNLELQGRLTGSRDFREPVVDVTQFRSPPPPATGGSAPTIRVLINGTHNAVIRLDDGDASIDPHNMTLRQIMKKIDDQLGGHGTCDIDDGKLVLRASQGGPSSAIELASIDEGFYNYLFGTDPTIQNGANEPTHGFYRSGVAFRLTDTITLPAGFDMKVTVNGTTSAPLNLTISGFPAGATITQIADYINQQMLADPAMAQAVLPEDSNQFSFAVLVDKSGKQVYPPLNGDPAPTTGEELYLKIQSHTWGTGSSIKLDAAATPPSAAFNQGMADLFGKGTINAPVVMGGVDGLEAEICRWLDVADAQLANLNRIWTDLGARMNRGELTKDRLELDGAVAETLLAENESVDEAKALTLLQIAETVYNASLSVGARVIQPTLMDFLN